MPRARFLTVCRLFHDTHLITLCDISLSKNWLDEGQEQTRTHFKIQCIFWLSLSFRFVCKYSTPGNHKLIHCLQSWPYVHGCCRLLLLKTLDPWQQPLRFKPTSVCWHKSLLRRIKKNDRLFSILLQIFFRCRDICFIETQRCCVWVRN